MTKYDEHYWGPTWLLKLIAPQLVIAVVLYELIKSQK